MNRSQAFLIGMLLFISGIACGSFVDLQQWVFWIGLLFVIALVTIWSKVGNAIKIAFFIFMFLLGCWRAATMRESFLLLDNLEGFKSSGVVTAIKEKGEYVQLIFSTHSVDKKIIITTSAVKDSYVVGDVLVVSCDLEKPQIYDDFDYRMYLAKDGVGWTCRNASILKQSRRKSLGEVLQKIRISGELVLTRTIPQPEAGFAKGIIFGGSGALTQEISDAFSRTGLTHVVAVSGFNVMIVAQYLMLLGIAVGFWRRQAVVFAIVGIVLFVMLVGFSASAVRAGCMASILLWAMRYGRLSTSISAISFSAVVMLFINPLLLPWDVGFQLSFLATIGVIYFYPLLEGEWVKKYSLLGITEAALLTISAQIFVLPILLYDFKSLSLISIFANMLVLPLIPFAMLLVFLTVVFGSVAIPIGFPFAWFSYLILHTVVVIVRYCASLPWASVDFSISLPMAIIWYIFLFAIIMKLKKVQINEK